MSGPINFICKKCMGPIIVSTLTDGIKLECTNCEIPEIATRKLYRVPVDVLAASGQQTFEVLAYSEEDAISEVRKGEGDISAEASEVEVTALGLDYINVDDVYEA